LIKEAHRPVHPIDQHQHQRKKAEDGQKLGQQISVESGQETLILVAFALLTLSTFPDRENCYLAKPGPLR
jgi:hypothetical protein